MMMMMMMKMNKKYRYYRIKCHAKNQSDHLTIIKNLMHNLIFTVSVTNRK